MKLCIKKVFDNNHYTQQEIANKIGSARQYVGALCNGTAKEIKIEQIIKLCEIFECTPNDLFEFTEKEIKKFNLNLPDESTTQSIIRYLLESGILDERTDSRIQNTLVEHKEDDTE